MNVDGKRVPLGVVLELARRNPGAVNPLDVDKMLADVQPLVEIMERMTSEQQHKIARACESIAVKVILAVVRRG